ncbi:MAG: chorismate mutase [Jiangellaceae bacterium]
MSLRAVRGATQLDVDERGHLLRRVRELVDAVLSRNALSSDDLVSIVFTATADLRSEFPAYAARSIGISDVPLLCAQELDVEGALPRVVRLMAHVETPLSRSEIRHVYLHGARDLRTDLPRDPG